MDGRPVLVSTEAEDPTADLVITELNRRLVPVLRFDPGRDFPTLATLAASITADGWSGTLTVGKRAADLSGVRALYHRRPNPYTPDTDHQTDRFAAQENRRGLNGVLGALPGCLYLSHPGHRPRRVQARTAVSRLPARAAGSGDADHQQPSRSEVVRHRAAHDLQAPARRGLPRGRRTRRYLGGVGRAGGDHRRG
ncbi:MvdC/MvdD family ATP grasp protein [Kitasatospora cineracea]|uniref:MvdC/MvdD family ATP grasp protein n=1 Tax=Kitasatospora cineracea TaxID=88074 RepID=UPI0036DF5756